ncbi:hypothetical protein L596_011203 [Steinernema carpocapsae]|uniref:Uncharacterized protein n=1 Tax=Steinernema carpocapsae TaxID=34508 RepID=A0A4U5NT07_STECR|nr:hypothetical protein L596_011203 [Steinernema carpocapsae]
MVEAAIKDAEKNAAANGVREDNFRFIACKAEDAFRDLQYLLPKGVDLKKANVVGVLDPPRAGIHERVVMTCRKVS